jgi:hypothetical protein
MISVVQVRHVQGRLPHYGEEARVGKSPVLYPAKVSPNVVPHDHQSHRPQHQQQQQQKQQQQPFSPQVPRSCARKAQTPKVDPLSDELRWDLLRELFKEVCACITRSTCITPNYYFLCTMFVILEVTRRTPL